MIPVNVSHAMSIDELENAYYELPCHTTSGPVCGACSVDARRWDRTADQVAHASVDHIRFCFATRARMDDESKAEREAEARNERFFEERGAGLDDPQAWGLGMGW